MNMKQSKQVKKTSIDHAPEFSPSGYCKLIKLLKVSGYNFSDYDSWRNYDKVAILRHDVDFSLHKAKELSNLEKKIGVTSTYFVLVRSNFYNPFSLDSVANIEKIIENGSEIGLHYDETLYGDSNHVEHILEEAEILSKLIKKPVTKVSMHRPSQDTLSASWEIPGMINSYSKEYFKDFKYVSDSRCRWREPVNEIIKSGHSLKLHVLTHPIWYEKPGSLHDTLEQFLTESYHDCYRDLNANFTDLGAVINSPQ